MPYGYGASQDYYDRAVQERDRNTGGNTGNNNQNNQGNQGGNDAREQFIASQVGPSGFQKYDTGQKMATGFGSVFGASSGSTGSSKTVQDSLKIMMNREMRNNPGMAPEEAANNAMNKFYPGFSGYREGGPMPVNLMGLYGGHKGIEEIWLDRFSNQGGGSGGGGGYGGWGSGGGGGYGGGGGGGYIEQELPPRGNPNERWGAQTPWQQMMINTHAGKGFQQGYARGGIVSLVE